MNPSIQLTAPRLARIVDFSYYFQDGDIFLLLGTTIFRLHREILAKNSAYFRDALALPRAGTAFTPGESEAHPLAVPDVLPSAFIQLLAIIYGKRKLPAQAESPTSAKIADTIALIRAGHKLKFNGVLEKAVACYEHSLPAATRLALGLSCDIDAWAAPAFVDIVLSFTVNPRNPYGLLNSEIMQLVHLARQEVAKARLEQITRRGFAVLSARSNGPSPVAFLDALVITRALPFSSRANFCKAFAAQAELLAAEFKIPASQWKPTHAQLAEWVSPVGEEVKLVESLWYRKSPSTIEFLFE